MRVKLRQTQAEAEQKNYTQEKTETRRVLNYKGVRRRGKTRETHRREFRRDGLEESKTIKLICYHLLRDCILSCVMSSVETA